MRYHLDDLLDDIGSDSEGSQVAAFFDYDKTLIAGYSVQAFFTEQIRSGQMSPAEFRTQAAAAIKYARKEIGFSDFVASTAKSLRGQAEFTFEEFGQRVYERKTASAIYPEARALIEAHKAKGHEVVIVSSATKYQIEPAARELGVDHVLCTELEVENGVFTGDVIRPACFGEGKRIAAEKYCGGNDAIMTDSYFYSDSDDDLPLFEAVGKPCAVNANDRLNAIAHQRRWPICDFSSRGRPTLKQIARTASIYASLPATLAATAPLWALSGNKRTALNAATTIWSEISTALAGLEFNVHGEEHLWSHRPAVFIFNHQSSIDPLILARLIRRDFTGIGKKEIKHFPIIGPAMTYADVVFIDRKSTEKAIRAIEPVISAIREDGLSVCLAPEGTRSPGKKLGAFKKGAFHIAMQAGVPIIPIIIHNATDSLPKGRHIARAAMIDVTVLPPVDTAKWSVKKLDKQIAEIRQMFLDTLGQTDEEA